MLKFFCDLTNGQFAAGFRDRSEPRHSFSQDNDIPFCLYLLLALSNSGPWPYSYDSWSGAGDITALVSLRDESTAAVLASTFPLNVVKDGFQGLLHTNTSEVGVFLNGRLEREALFSIDLVDGGGNKINPFRRAVILRANPSTVPSPAGTILYFREVNTYLGSGPNALQAKNTAGRLGVIFEAVINGILVSWRVESGTATTDLGNGILRPGDYDAATNPVNLVRVGGI